MMCGICNDTALCQTRIQQSLFADLERVTDTHVDSVTPYPSGTAVLYYRWLAAGLHDKIISQGVGSHKWECVTRFEKRED